MDSVWEAARHERYWAPLARRTISHAYEADVTRLMSDFDTILKLVGALDDSAGDNTSRVRVREPHAGRDVSSTRDASMGYTTTMGEMVVATAETALASPLADDLRGKVQLIFTSPPFPLNTKKRYGNLQGEDYIRWLADFAPHLRTLLTPDGSIAIELGNAWEPGRPVMSTLALRALLAFQEAGEFNLCQTFVCQNPARLPSPAQWVTVERIRVKDSFTHVWWLAPSDRPKADNRRVLTQYGPRMRRLLAAGEFNSGHRPSEHNISASAFLRDNGGAIPGNVLSFANTSSADRYLRYCRERKLRPHPARMPRGLADFFIRLLTDPGDLVLDPFAGSNTTGAAAERLGRRWISFEPMDEYVRGSEGRFENAARSERSLA